MRSDRLVLRVAAGAVCALLLLPAVAQTLYKSIMPDGRVVYGDKPVRGAAKVEESQADTSKSGLGGVVTPREVTNMAQRFGEMARIFFAIRA